MGRLRGQCSRRRPDFRSIGIHSEQDEFEEEISGFLARFLLDGVMSEKNTRGTANGIAITVDGPDGSVWHPAPDVLIPQCAVDGDVLKLIEASHYSPQSRFHLQLFPGAANKHHDVCLWTS